VAEIEKLGKPGVMIDVAQFKADSKSAALGIGFPDLPIVALPIATTAGKSEAELLPIARGARQEVIDALTKEPAVKTVAGAPKQLKAKPATVLTFKGTTAKEAQENMEKYFLANKWSDGLPMVPATPEAVEEMLKGTDLPRYHVVGIVDPKHGIASVEKIAINAVMAGARPAYMPVIIAAVEALSDPEFDLFGVQATTGLTAPLVIVSGPIIDDININFSYSTAGPGWRANSTIGRATRLMMVNLGQAWPGINDMKDVGNPAKFGIVMAENDRQTPQGWTTMREREGFKKQSSTVSLYASQSYRQIHDSQKYLAASKKPEPIVDPMLARLMSTSLNSTAEQWGEELVIAFSPTMAENLKNFGYTPEKIQKELYEKGRIPRGLFGPRPLGSYALTSGIPKWIDDLPDDALVPVVPKPEDIKIVVSGGKGGGASFLIDRWGFGNSRYVTKEIKLPKNWKKLVKDLNGWETPIEVK
jgi:hypothetical protein